MSTCRMATVVSNLEETTPAALCTTKFCTAGTPSSSDSAKGSKTTVRTIASNTFPNIFIPLCTNSRYNLQI